MRRLAAAAAGRYAERIPTVRESVIYARPDARPAAAAGSWGGAGGAWGDAGVGCKAAFKVRGARASRRRRARATGERGAAGCVRAKG